MGCRQYHVVSQLDLQVLTIALSVRGLVQYHLPSRLEASVELVPDVHGFQGVEGLQKLIRLTAALDLAQRVVGVEGSESGRLGM